MSAAHNAAVAVSSSSITTAAANSGGALSVAPVIPQSVTRGVAEAQSAIDPFMLPLLVALLALAAWALRRRRAQAGARAGLGVALPGASADAAGHVPSTWPWCAAVIAVAAPLWASLAWGVHRGAGAWVAGLDAAGMRWAAALAAPWVQRLAVVLGDVGDVLALSVFTVAVGLWLLRRRQRFLAGAWLLSIVINSVAVRVLKNAFDRARPEHAADLVTSGASFPSGHAAGALMVFGLLVWVLGDQWPSERSTWVAWAGAVLVAAIAASRVLLGVHYLSDVLGGLLWTAMTLAASIAVIDTARRG